MHLLLPPGTWDWYALGQVRYRGQEVTIFWDREGRRFQRGAGLTVLVDGRVAARADGLDRVTARLP